MAFRRVISTLFLPRQRQCRLYSKLAAKEVIPPRLVGVFADIVGPTNVNTTTAAREHHAKDESGFACTLPSAVLTPGSTQEVSECIKVCSAEKLPMIPFGTGTGVEGGIIPIGSAVTFDLSRMDQISDLSPEDFYVTVEPGVTRKTLNSHLRDTGLWFPIDPGADASLCGMAATSASGTNAVKYGTMKENVINLEVVLPNGQVVHTAGPKMRARKTSAGYNLTNMFVGSEGTLGVITKATLRLYGIPEAMVSAVCQFPDIQSAVDTTVMIQQTGIPVARVEFLDDVQMKACNLYSQLEYDELPTLFLEFHGQTGHIESQARAVEELAVGNGGSRFEWAQEASERNKLWTARHNVLYASKSLNPTARVLTTDVCVPLSALTKMVTDTKQDILNSGLTGPIVGHVGDGNFHCLLLFSNEEEHVLAEQVASRMALKAISLGGTCTGEHGIGIGKMSFLENEIGPTGFGLMKNIKNMLDPEGLMNPGKIIPE